MRRVLLVASIVAAARLGAQADARQALVDVTRSADTVTIGDPFTVHIRVRAPKVATIRFPDVPASADGIDPVDPRSVEDGAPGEMLDRTATYRFVAWDVGSRGPVFEPITITVAGQSRAIAVVVPPVFVQSLLPADSAEQVPRDARAPVPLAGRLWQFILLGTIALAGLILYWRRWRRLRRERAESTGTDAWQDARTAWQALDDLKLDEAGEPGRHVIAHVDVLRHYLARRFPPVALTLNAGEATAVLTDLDFPVPVPRVAELLARDSELRFAHAAIAPDEATALATEARDITAQIQLAHEARLRAIERPPRPRRR
jgi:hypothetical protein